jgi:hypothetical protein
MLHPHGPQPPAVYWRRRLGLAISLFLVLLLIVLTAHVMLSSNSPKHPVAADSSVVHSPSTGASSPAAPSSTAPAPSSPVVAPSSAPVVSSPPVVTSPPTPKPCLATALKIVAATAAPTYAVGASPMLLMRVTNKGPAPCLQDLADRQIVMQVFNGESRVWGSHDCQIQPGTSNRILAVAKTVQVSLVWSGLSSEPKCAGTRQRVGAGTYTLYVSLSGHTGTSVKFAVG